MTTRIAYQARVEAAGFVAIARISLNVWDRVGGKTSYSAGAAGAAAAIKALAKAAKFEVLSCTSENYTGWSSVDIYVESELTPEQRENNERIIKQYGSMGHPDYIREPRADLLNDICKHFQQGNFDGMTDMYEYKKGGATITDPEGDEMPLDAKYVFSHFTTKEEFSRYK